METKQTRRTFCRRAFAASATVGLLAGRPALASPDAHQPDQRIPLKIGIRQTTLRLVGDVRAIQAAAAVPGIDGIELQVTAGKRNLRDPDVVLAYKREAHRWAMHIPSLSGVWDPGVNVYSARAFDSLVKSLRAAELLGASVILVAFFRKNAPDMTRESSYGPVVDLFRKVAPIAADAGITLGLENSLSPADNKKLVDLVDHPAVKVYYDVYNMAYYGHADQAVDGIRLLGKERICMVHVKNGRKRLEEPGPVDWAAALAALSEIGYEGWLVYETRHDSFADCVRDTQRNNTFIRRHLRMPVAPPLVTPGSVRPRR